MASAGNGAGAAGSSSQAAYASDGFSSPPGDINSGYFEIGRTSGTGWGSAWQQGEHSGPGFFAFANAKPLSFSNLATSGNYMAHRTWDLGRGIDLKNPRVAPLVQDGQIAKAGTVVWVSSLVRLDSTVVTRNADVVFLTTHRSGLGYHFYGDTAWAAGVYPSRGVTNWSLWVSSGTSQVTPNMGEPRPQLARSSNKPVTIGTAQLIVVKIEISGGSSDRISLYVDPPALGGKEPVAADVTAMTGQSARFKAFAFSGGGNDDAQYASSFDEVRIGPTFASVTPTQ